MSGRPSKDPLAEDPPRYLRTLTSPKRFLMFWTVGTEIPVFAAVSAPVHPRFVQCATLETIRLVTTARFFRADFGLAPFFSICCRAPDQLPDARESKRWRELAKVVSPPGFELRELTAGAVQLFDDTQRSAWRAGFRFI